MNRYQKYNYLAQSFIASKSSLSFTYQPVNVQHLQVQAGHFRFNRVFAEHGLILTDVSNQIPKAQVFAHGKKKQDTILLSADIGGKNIWPFLDKFINFVLPTMRAVGNVPGLETVKMRRANGVYVWRVRKYFELASSFHFMTARIVKREVYLPLFLSIDLAKGTLGAGVDEVYLRMLRLPFIFYKRKKPKGAEDGRFF
jgi:hypothetical protein